MGDESGREGASHRSPLARHAIRTGRNRVGDPSGEFGQPEDSERARRLTTRWEEKWPGLEPVGHLLRAALHDRWIRFHGPPRPERDADGAVDDGIVRRYRTVLDELLRGEPIESLTLIAQDWDRWDVASGWVRSLLPQAWPWRSSVVEGDTSIARRYLWADSGLDENALDTLLAAAADDEARFILAGADLTWLFCPYDSGVDVIASSIDERDALLEHHPDWMSARDDWM